MTVKRSLSVFLTILMLLSLGFSVSAGTQEAAYVKDESMVLLPEQAEALRKLAAEASEKVGCDICILTVWDYKDMGYDPSQSITKILRQYYFDNGYGRGPDQDGILLMLSMKERDFALFSNGFGHEGLTDAAKDYLLENFLDDFKHNSWYNGFEDYITCSQKLLQRTLNGHPFTEHTATTGEWILGCVLCMIIGIAITGIVTHHFEKQMNSVETDIYAWEFASPLRLKVKTERFDHSSTTRVYDPPSSSSGSGGGGGGSYGSGCSRSGKF